AAFSRATAGGNCPDGRLNLETSHLAGRKSAGMNIMMEKDRWECSPEKGGLIQSDLPGKVVVEPSWASSKNGQPPSVTKRRREICDCADLRTGAWEVGDRTFVRYLREIGAPFPKDAQLYRGCGCEHCRRTGYRSRAAIYEICMVN